MRALAPGCRSPLYIAAEHGSVGCVEALLRLGRLGVADCFQASSRLTTPLSVARRRGHTAVAELLHEFVDLAGGAVSSQHAAPAALRRSSSLGAAGSTPGRLRMGSPSPRRSSVRSGRPISGLVRSLSLPWAAREESAAVVDGSQASAPTVLPMRPDQPTAASPSPRPRPHSARPAATPRQQPQQLEPAWQQRQHWRQGRLSQEQGTPRDHQSPLPSSASSSSIDAQQRQRAAVIAAERAKGLSQTRAAASGREAPCATPRVMDEAPQASPALGRSRHVPREPSERPQRGRPSGCIQTPRRTPKLPARRGGSSSRSAAALGGA